MKNFTGN